MLWFYFTIFNWKLIIHPYLENVDVWKEKVGFIKHGNKILDFFSTHCCSGKSTLFGKSVTVSVMGIPPYIIFDPETKVLGGVDVELLKIIARKFLLQVTIRPEKTWLDKLENGTIIGTVASVRFSKNLKLILPIHVFFNFQRLYDKMIFLKYIIDILSLQFTKKKYLEYAL